MIEAAVVRDAEALRRFAQQLLENAGASAEHAALTADMLIAANLRGVDSHGLQLLPYYLDRIATGDMDPRAEGRPVSETGATMVFDGRNGLGAVVAAACCDHAVRLAKAYGLGLVVARESNHFGMLAFWGRRIARHGCIGILMCNASPMVPPWQGREPRLGTNPICVAVPGPPQRAWLLDMATTTVAAGKIYKAHINGQPEIPPGWALDRQGRPTTDTATAMQGLLMPLGGYKGSGLAMMAEILCAVLGGGATGLELGGIRLAGRPMRVSQFYLAIDVAHFQDLPQFEQRMDALVDSIKSTPPAVDYDEVLVAGETEARMEARRAAEGIPISAGTWEQLRKAAHRLGVTVP